MSCVQTFQSSLQHQFFFFSQKTLGQGALSNGSYQDFVPEEQGFDPGNHESSREVSLLRKGANDG
jgi:hypothetical protein